MRENYRRLAFDYEITNDTRISKLNNNDLVIGSSGAGKTGGYVFPLLQNTKESLVVSDTKNILYSTFKEDLKRRGYRVELIDFVNPRNSTISFDPFKGIEKNEDGSYSEQDVIKLCTCICRSMDNKEPIWDFSARNYLSFFIAYCLEEFSEEDHCMDSVIRLYHAFINSNGTNAFEEKLKNKSSFAYKKYCEIMANKVADKMYASVLGFVNVALTPFDFKDAKYLFARENAIDLRELGKYKTALFVNVSDTDRSFDATINLLYSQTFNQLFKEADRHAESRLAQPVRIIMDDYAAGTPIEDFEKITSVLRSREMAVSVILQSLSQLKSIYGDSKATTIMNNCDHIIYMGAQDIETAEYVSYRAGKTPEVVLAMPRDKVYILTNGERARLSQKIEPYSTGSKYTGFGN